jgi:hypothetical protein
VLAAAGAGPALAYTAAASGVILLAAAALACAVRAQRGRDPPRSLAWSYAAYAAALCLAAWLVVPAINRWQDLPALAARIHADTASQPLGLLDPDETTVAMLDHGRATPFIVLTSGATPRGVVSDWFATRGPASRVLVLLPGHASGPLTRFLNRLHPQASPDDGVAGTLAASGAAVLVERYELPQGRRYALLGPPAAH